MPRTFYLVAGEHSGDTRGAELMEALRERWPDCRFHGLGGPKMTALADGGVEDWVDEAAVVGLWEVLRKYSYFKARLEKAKRDVGQVDPDALILVDYPGFNLRLARAVREAGAKARIVDYISPQVWAWKKGRVFEMAHYLDLMCCLFPFEVDLFQQVGIRTVCIGHPLVQQLEAVRIAGGREEKLVGLFPGSREREVARLLPEMLAAAAALRKEDPELRFVVAAASESLGATIREMSRDHEGIEVQVGKAHELMQRAMAGVVASGTATLEASYYGLPHCLVYKVAWPTYLAGRMVVKIDFIGMANILAGKMIAPELIQHEATADNITAFLESVLGDEGRREAMTRDLLAVADQLGQGRAAERGAEAIDKLLDESD